MCRRRPPDVGPVDVVAVAVVQSQIGMEVMLYEAADVSVCP